MSYSPNTSNGNGKSVSTPPDNGDGSLDTITGCLANLSVTPNVQARYPSRIPLTRGEERAMEQSENEERKKSRHQSHRPDYQGGPPGRGRGRGRGGRGNVAQSGSRQGLPRRDLRSTEAEPWWQNSGQGTRTQPFPPTMQQAPAFGTSRDQLLSPPMLSTSKYSASRSGGGNQMPTPSSVANHAPSNEVQNTHGGAQAYFPNIRQATPGTPPRNQMSHVGGPGVKASPTSPTLKKVQMRRKEHLREDKSVPEYKKMEGQATVQGQEQRISTVPKGTLGVAQGTTGPSESKKADLESMKKSDVGITDPFIETDKKTTASARSLTASSSNIQGQKPGLQKSVHAYRPGEKIEGLGDSRLPRRRNPSVSLAKGAGKTSETSDKDKDTFVDIPISPAKVPIFDDEEDWVKIDSDGEAAETEELEASVESMPKPAAEDAEHNGTTRKWYKLFMR